MITTSTRVEDAKLHEMQQLAGLPFPPTEATYAFRQAINGEGDRAFDWQDKPHRLVYDLCRIIEADAAANAALRSEILELRAQRSKGADAMTTEEQQLVERLKPSYVVDAGLNIIMIVLRDHGAAAEAQVLNEWIVANNALKAKAVAALIASEAKVAELQEALKPFAKAADVKLCGEWRDDERFGHTDITFHLTFGDLRAARRALEASK